MDIVRLIESTKTDAGDRPEVSSHIPPDPILFFWQFSLDVCGTVLGSPVRHGMPAKPSHILSVSECPFFEQLSHSRRLLSQTDIRVVKCGGASIESTHGKGAKEAKAGRAVRAGGGGAAVNGVAGGTAQSWETRVYNDIP